MNIHKLGVYVGTATVMLVVIYLGLSVIYFAPKKPAIPVAEANRQADVMSQLRAAEIGDFAEMIDGTMLGIWWTSTDSDGITKRIVLCGFGGRCTIYDSIPISIAAKRVERIIKLNGQDQMVLSVAKQFMRQY